MKYLLCLLLSWPAVTFCQECNVDKINNDRSITSWTMVKEEEE